MFPPDFLVTADKFDFLLSSTASFMFRNDFYSVELEMPNFPLSQNFYKVLEVDVRGNSFLRLIPIYSGFSLVIFC